MDIVTLMYIYLGGFVFLALFVTLFLLAGKEIYFAIYRRVQPKGCFVFVVNSSRHTSEYYKVPKDNQFRIGNKIYITNPEKVLSMSDDDRIKDKIKEGLDKKRKRLEARIAEFEKQKEIAIDKLKGLADLPANKPAREQYKHHIVMMEQKIAEIKSKLDVREQVYYHKRRAAFFYIEGDPIPKDFHELYTQMDSIAIDNVIARSMTKDPKAIANLEKEIKTMKFLIIISIIAAAAAAVIAITIKTDVQTIIQSVGGTITI